MEDRRRIAFDNKIPLTWLISSAATALLLLATLLWNVALQSNKLDQLIAQSEKMEKGNIARDEKLESLWRDTYDAKRNSEIVNTRVQELERSRSK